MQYLALLTAELAIKTINNTQVPLPVHPPVPKGPAPSILQRAISRRLSAGEPDIRNVFRGPVHLGGGPLTAWLWQNDLFPS
jgi:hypothetical protein